MSVVALFWKLSVCMQPDSHYYWQNPKVQMHHNVFPALMSAGAAKNKTKRVCIVEI